MRAMSGYAIAAVLLTVGVGAADVILNQQRRLVVDRLQQLVVPGEHEIVLSQEGAHAIFHEERAMVGGRYFASDRQLNGLKLRLRLSPTGEDVSISAPAARTHYALADREGSAIAAFHIARPGTYHLTAWYPESAYDTTAVVAIGQGIDGLLLTTTVAAIGAAALGAIAGAVVAIRTFRRRRRAAMNEHHGRIVEEAP